MKRDMDLARKILLEIEKQYVSTAIYDLDIEGYDVATVAYHCKILYEAGLISNYKHNMRMMKYGLLALGLSHGKVTNIWTRSGTILSGKKQKIQ